MLIGIDPTKLIYRHINSNNAIKNNTHNIESNHNNQTNHFVAPLH